MFSVHDDDALRRGMRDLVALTTLPNIWAGSPPQTIAESLSDVLLNILRLELVYIRLNKPDGNLDAKAFDLVRTPTGLCSDNEVEQVSWVFAPYLDGGAAPPTEPVPDPLSDGMLQIATIPIGLNGKDGYIGTGSRDAQPLSEMERMLLTVAASQAVTALKQAYLLSDLRAAYQKEQAARAEAEKANQLKMQFLAMISHELRTPLTSIKGFSSTLLAEDVHFTPEDQREYLRIIDQEADSLKELIEQLLDLSRLQAGTMSILPEPILVKQLVDMVYPSLKMLTPQHKLVVKVSDKPLVIRVDATRIGQVISNLVHNAVKFSPPDTNVMLQVMREDRYVRFDVKDQGVGIPTEERPHLFEAFRQIERKSHIQTGAGLGLAICKGLVEAHGGKIWIADSEATGTTISFTLPVVST